MRLSRSFTVLAAGALALRPQPSHAWDSSCYRFIDPDAPVSSLLSGAIVADSRGCDGLEAARGRWRDPVKRVDEHRQIFVAAVARAGLPLSLLQTQTLAVLTDRRWVHGKTGALRTVAPHRPTGAQPEFSGAKQSFSLDGLAQLPDFSYGLWDWAAGNETCPIPGLPSPHDDPQACHKFETHMGATNANHFPPQSEHWFDRYHALALAGARQCRTSRAQVWERAIQLREEPHVVDDRMAEFWKACEVEALAYEAVAQHYLQDSWSSGHMWERWGSADVADVNPLVADGPFVRI